MGYNDQCIKVPYSHVQGNGHTANSYVCFSTVNCYFFVVVNHHELQERLRYINILLLILVKVGLRVGSLSICLLDFVHDTRHSFHARKD